MLAYLVREESGGSTPSNHVESNWSGHQFWYKCEYRKTNANTARYSVPCPRTDRKDEQNTGQHN